MKNALQKSRWTTAESHPRIEGALHKYGLSVFKVNVIFGKSEPLSNKALTLEAVHRELLAYYEATGKRPHQRSRTPDEIPTATSRRVRNRRFASINEWLIRNESSSIHKECDKLGIPGGRVMNRTMDSTKKEFLEYHKSTGTRPTSSTHGSQEKWLNARDTTVSSLCDDLSIPGDGKVVGRTDAQVNKELKTYSKETGKRPTYRSHNAISQWLSNRGTTLNQRCDELGIRGGYRISTTLDEVDGSLDYHLKRTGERPKATTHNHEEQWLRRHQGSSVSKRCDELGMPPYEHKGGPRPLPLLPCHVCGGSSTRMSSRNARAGRKPYCEKHKGGRCA